MVGQLSVNTKQFAFGNFQQEMKENIKTTQPADFQRI